MKSITPYTPKTMEREWGAEIFVAETPHYLGKVLFYAKGKAGGLQYHVEKDETFYLFRGKGRVEFDDGTGRLTATEMTPGMSFRIPPGAPHRFYAEEDCVVFETSTPHYDDRVRCENAYGVSVIGDGPGLPTTKDQT